tara:strand:+ start:895 stop:1845 length:951 start_codon:yes stop_codon:yes gene_type:complete
MKVADFKLHTDDFGIYGQGLHRPECVWIDSDGVWASDARGGVALVHSDKDPTLLGSGILEPNGYSRRPDGSFVVAGLLDGALHHILSDGSTLKLLDKLGGKPLGTVNCAWADGEDRIWVSVMTRDLPWHSALSSKNIDGYILRVEGNGAKVEIVADGLDLTNEVKVSPDGKYLYAAESLACRIVRFPIHSDGALGSKETVGPKSLGRGAFPDGFAFDPFGNIWVTIVSRNGLYVIDKSGNIHIVYEDANESAVEIMAAGVDRRDGHVEQFAACASTTGPLVLPTSLAFGGEDGRTGFIGSLPMPHLTTFRLSDGLD